MLTYIHELIDRNKGSISISAFMDAALYHKKYGYYMNKVPFGKNGDFVTAPEISQLFGEIMAIWVMHTWEKLGKPEKFSLTELGPGKGNLVHDITRVTKKYNDFFCSMSLHLIEVSPILRSVQEQTLRGLNVKWHEGIDNLPEQPTIFIANEFFDALPINQFTYNNGQWYENRIAKQDDSNFKIVQAETTDFYNAVKIMMGYENLDGKFFDGAVMEVSPLGIEILSRIEEKIHKSEGAALIIDYGYIYSSYKSTLQSIKQHNYSNFLQDVGSSDITTLVNFQALKHSLQYANCEILTQREFLYLFCIKERVQNLMKNANNVQKNKIFNEFLRLTENMGTLFKAMLIYS